MLDTNIHSQDVIFALDIGTRSVIGTVGVVKDKKFYVLGEVYEEHEERAMIDGQIHNIELVAHTVGKIKRQLEDKLNIKLSNVAIAAAGRFLKTNTVSYKLDIDYNRKIDKDLVRTLELTAVKKAEEEINNKTKGKLYCVGYSVVNYYLNGYVISNLISHKGENISADVIATFLPRSVVDSIYSVTEKVGLQVVSLTLEPIAAMEAVIPQNLRLLNLALVDIGAGTSDIAISDKDTIKSYGMVSLAGDEITEVIAQNCLVDFNGAEKIKRQTAENDIITYTDVLGMENEITSEEIKNMIKPVVDKISKEIGDRIIELNGGKSPNAVFLVGGGSYTLGMKEGIAKVLNIPDKRIAIKGRDAISNCVCEDNSLGSIGVTVLGIALVSIKKLGHDFIDVILNGSIISLFNSHSHTVMDVMLQGGINPSLLIGKNGKSVKFTLNGRNRVAFGTLATNSKIEIDGKEANIDSQVQEGQSIKIDFATNGKNACPQVKDYIKNLYSVTFYINDIIHTLNPIGIINENSVSIEEIINEGDKVEIVDVKTLGEFKKFFENNIEPCKYFANGEEIFDDYIIKEGDRIYKVSDNVKDEEKKEENQEVAVEQVDAKDIETSTIHTEEKHISETDNENDSFTEVKEEVTIDSEKLDDSIKVIVNGEQITLKGKKTYVFVDIFNYIDMDLSCIHGKLVLKLNGEDTDYNASLKDGDTIEARWS